MTSKFRIELDDEVQFDESMIETITLHSKDGVIWDCAVRNQIDDPAKYVGTHPTAWIDKRFHARVKAALKAAAKGQTPAPCKYLLAAELYGGAEYTVETLWRPCPAADMPIMGISRTLPALPKLTESQKKLIRDIAEKRALPHAGGSSSALRAAKSRLIRKLKISAQHLQSFCIDYADLV